MVQTQQQIVYGLLVCIYFTWFWAKMCEIAEKVYGKGFKHWFLKKNMLKIFEF